MQAVLHVEHKGKPQMCGKVWTPYKELHPVFYHEERQPTQHLIVYDSPGGIDAAIIGWLREYGVQEVWHRPYQGTHLYIASLDEIQTKGKRRRLDGRDRFFLPYEHWRQRLLPPRWRVPWIEDVVVVAPEWALLLDEWRTA